MQTLWLLLLLLLLAPRKSSDGSAITRRERGIKLVMLVPAAATPQPRPSRAPLQLTAGYETLCASALRGGPGRAGLGRAGYIALSGFISATRRVH